MSAESEDDDVVETKDGGETLGKYKIVKYIEKGSFGDVHLAKNVETGEQVAIKIVDRRKAIGSGSTRKKAVMDELNILKVKHHAIIELKDFFVTRDYLVLVMEFCSGGDLFTLAMKEAPLPEYRAKHIFRQILEGIQHLHKLNIIHRDIKLENILLKEQDSDEVRITDFGMSRIISRVNLATTQCGTMEYTAPEVFKFQPYGRECDYWSLGILLYDLLSTELPFTSVEDIMGCEHKPVDFDSSKWDDVSESAKELVENLLVFNPDNRWTIDQALHCAWLKELDGANTVDMVPDTKIGSPANVSPSHTPASSSTAPSPKKRGYDTPSPSPSPSFGMSLRKRIKIKLPYDV